MTCSNSPKLKRKAKEKATEKNRNLFKINSFLESNESTNRGVKRSTASNLSSKVSTDKHQPPKKTLKQACSESDLGALKTFNNNQATRNKMSANDDQILAKKVKTTKKGNKAIHKLTAECYSCLLHV